MLSVIYAECHLCWASSMLSIIYAECHLCWVSSMLSIIYAECHLCWVSFMLSVIYAECHLCWVSSMLSVIYAECHLCWVSSMWAISLFIVHVLGTVKRKECWIKWHYRSILPWHEASFLIAERDNTSCINMYVPLLSFSFFSFLDVCGLNHRHLRKKDCSLFLIVPKRKACWIPWHFRSILPWHEVSFLIAERDNNSCINMYVWLLSLSFLDVCGLNHRHLRKKDCSLFLIVPKRKACWMSWHYRSILPWHEASFV